MFEAILTFKFMQYALITCVLVSIISGIIGVFVCEKKLVMLSGGVAHTAYGGVGLSFLIGVNPSLLSFVFAGIAAIVIARMSKYGGEKTDILIGLFWSLGMALGVIFVSFTPGLPPNLSSYLFGNILMVLKFDLYIALAVTIIIVFLVIAFFNSWRSFLFDQEFFSIGCKKAAIFEYTLMLMIALSTVVLIKVAGIILVIAMLTAPCGTASLFTKRLKSRIVLSVAFSLLFCLAGFTLSYYLDIPSAAAIVIFSVIVYAFLFLIKRLNNYAINQKKAKN